jgi:thiol-disulfide isomerase/thioredoxin
MILTSGWLPALLALAAAVQAGAPRPSLAWTPAAGSPSWSIDVGTDAREAGVARSVPLEAPAWFEPLPEISVPLLEGGSFALSSARGKVLLLDFWASWCAPCMKELPSLESLVAAEGARGLAAVAINVGEPRPLARRTADAIHLTLPIGSYDREADDAFQARELPTIVIADRRGRFRGRWEGWREGIEKTIADRARELLAEDPAGPKRTLAQVLRGAGALEVEWVRDLGAVVTGIAVAPVPGARPRIEVAAGRELTTLERDGRIASRVEAPSAAGRLVPANLDGTGGAEVVGFRPGGKDVVVIDVGSARSRSFPAPAYLLDLAAADADPLGRPKGLVALATVDGLYLADGEGGHPLRVLGTGETVSVLSTGTGLARRFVALGADGNIRWVDPEGRVVRTAAARSGDSRLVLGDGPSDGFGSAAPTVVASATGRFLSKEVALIAVATDAAAILLDPARGRPVWQARWKGIGALASGDLDGDGKAELLVAAGRSVALLRARR